LTKKAAATGSMPFDVRRALRVHTHELRHLGIKRGSRRPYPIGSRSGKAHAVQKGRHNVAMKSDDLRAGIVA
jgi:hypothetical protein